MGKQGKVSTRQSVKPSGAGRRCVAAGTLSLSLLAGPLAAQTLKLGTPGANSETLQLVDLTTEQSGLQDYVLQWSLDGFATLAGQQKLLPAGAAFEAKNLQGGKTYSFRASRPGWTSNVVTAIPVLLVAPNASVASVSPLGAQLAWTTPARGNGLSFRVDYSAVGVSRSLVTSNTSVLVNLPLRETASLRVTPLGTSPAQEGPASGSLAVTMPSIVSGTLPAPGGLRLLSNVGSCLTWWPVAGATHYKVSRVDNTWQPAQFRYSVTFQWNASSTSSRDSNSLPKGSPVGYVVQACTATGCGAPAAPAQAKVGSGLVCSYNGTASGSCEPLSGSEPWTSACMGY